jgi:hypothetical protein
VARYKKIKAFDPFSKTRGQVPERDTKNRDHAPKAMDAERIPRKMKELMRLTNSQFNKPKHQSFKQNNNGPSNNLLKDKSNKPKANGESNKTSEKPTAEDNSSAPKKYLSVSSTSFIFSFGI